MSGSRKLQVAVDASNGMAGTMVPKVFGEAKGLKIARLNFENSSGEFVHEPNPLVEANLAQLKERVKAVNADLGLCFDGDADRCVVVDERGQTIGCDLLGAWLALSAGSARAPSTGHADRRNVRPPSDVVPVL